MRLADDGDEAQRSIADTTSDAWSSRRKASDSTIGKPPVRSASVSAAPSPGKATMRRLSQPQVSPSRQPKQSCFTPSHASQGTSHDTRASSAPRSSSPPDSNADVVPHQTPPIPTSSSSTSAMSHVYASTTADSDSQHQHTGNTPSLARSGSGASTIPTSPETELTQSILRSASYDRKIASTSNEDCASSHLALSRDDGTEALLAPAEQVYQTSSSTTSGTGQPAHQNPLFDVLSRKPPPVQPSRTAASGEDRMKHRQRVSLAHRNKPLPIPTEAPAAARAIAHGAQRHAMHTREKVSSEVEQRKGDATAAGGKDPSKHIDSSHATASTLATPSRSTLKSMLTRSSSKLFRSSMYADRHAEGEVPNPPMLLEMSATAHQTSSDSQRPVSGSSHSSSESSHANRAGAHMSSRPHVLMPSATSRSPSPFQQFMRNARGRPSSGSQTTGPRHAKASDLSPPLQPSSLASSTSSLQSNSPPLATHQRSSFAGSDTPLQKRPSLSFRLSQHLGSVFSGTAGETSFTPLQKQQSGSSSLHATHLEDRSDTMATAMADASRKLHQRRPPLMRMRSRSVGDVRKTMHPEAIKSLAIGIPVVDTMESSAASGDGASWDPKSNPASSEGREGTLSRLAGPLQRRPHPSKIPVKVSHDSSPPSSAPIWATMSLKHRRHKSNAGPLVAWKAEEAGSGTMVRTSSQPSVPPATEYIDDAPEGRESWWYTSKADATAVLECSSNDTTLSRFEAAHLALALSAGDDTVEARMEAAGRSPPTLVAALPLATTEPTVGSKDAALRSSSVRPGIKSDQIGTDNERMATAMESAASSRSRSSSLTTTQQPLSGIISPRKGHSEESSLSSGYESAASTLRNHNAASNDNDSRGVSTSGSRVRHSLYADSPPSSFNAIRYAHLTKSDSDSNRQMGDIAGEGGVGGAEATERRGSEATIKHETRSGGGHVRRSSTSAALLNSDTKADVRVSPAPMARIRKLSTPSALSSQRKNIGSEKPALRLDTDLLKSEPLIARPASAMGMSAHLERNMHRDMRRQPTLSIADDLEFLQVLEHVRRDNQDRIKRQREEAVKHAELARFGLAPRSTRKSSGGSSGRRAVRQALSSANEASSSSNCDSTQLTSAALVESPLSEDGSNTSSASLRRPDGRSMSVSSAHRPSPLELGVGKASGKLRDGAFLNDEDWKKEVKALFVIRELVLTERSYAAYLEALLQAVRQVSMQPPSRRSTTPSLLMTSSATSSNFGSHAGGSTAHAAPHIVLMRNLLPQLIAMSRTLVNRIDENPTAAGVGAAFRLVSVQMEATFVAWSGAITEIMEALRASEGPKGKARGRIGLIGVHVERPVPSASPMSSASASVPSSPVRLRVPLRDNSAKSLTTPHETVGPYSLPSSSSDSSTSRGSSTAKRRSTLSSMSPSVAANLRAKLSASSALPSPTAARAAAALDDSASLSSGDGSRLGPHNEQSRGSAASIASPITRKGGVMNSSNQFLASTSSFLDNALSMSPSSLRTSGTSTPSHKGADAATPKSVEFMYSSNGSKKLTAMDVAIMPTQRLPRYLLLLRDLHANTPPQSLSNMRLQSSLDFVHRVAALCDRASKTAAHCKTPSNYAR